MKPPTVSSNMYLLDGSVTLIRYNYLKIAATREGQIYKLLESDWIQKIQEVQVVDLDKEQYKNREATYVLRSIIKEFVKSFHKGLT